jgi:ribosomal protein S27AE
MELMRMKIRPGRTRSLIGGILVLAVTFLGLLMIESVGGGPLGGPPAIFKLFWLGFGLIAAGAAFYNAFSERGIPLYEVDLEENKSFCPQCGQPVGENDQFCRHCGQTLR